MSLLSTLDSAHSRYYNDQQMAHGDWIKSIAAKWAMEVESRLTYISLSIGPIPKKVELQWWSVDTVDGKFILWPADDLQPECWLIQLSLGLSPKSLALVNRVLAVKNAFSGDYYDERTFSDWDDDELCPGVFRMDPEGLLEARCERVIIDIAHLALLHEVAHGVEGHKKLVHVDAAMGRAEEAFADLGAGWLFMHFILSEHKGPGKLAFEPATGRLIDAAFFLTTLFHRVRSISNDYHLPNTRLHCFLWGAIAAGDGNEVQANNWLSKYFEERTLNYAVTLLSSDHRNRYNFWTDSAMVEADMDDFHRNTSRRIKTNREHLTLARTQRTGSTRQS